MGTPSRARVNKGSVTLRSRLRKRNATRELARRLACGADLVSRWASGERKPVPVDRALLEQDPELRIPWKWWDEELDAKGAAAFERALGEAEVEDAPKARLSRAAGGA